MEEITMQQVYIWVAILVAIHAGGSQLAGVIWQSYSDHRIDELDMKAIRVLWFVFLPLGLATVVFAWLDITFPQHAPIRMPDEWQR
jgi:hypothetical protein